MGKPDPELERQRLRDVYSKLSAEELRKLAGDMNSLTDVARQVLHYEMTLRQLEHKPDAGEYRDIHDVSLENEWADAISSTLLPLEQRHPGINHAGESLRDHETQDEDDQDEFDDDAESAPSMAEEGRIRAQEDIYGLTSLAHTQLITIRWFRDLPEALLAKGGLNSAGIECCLADDNMVRLDWFMSNFVGGIKLQVQPEDVEAANAILEQPIPEDFEVDGVGEYLQPRCPKCQSLDTTFEELNKPVAYGSAFLNFPLPVHHRGWRCHTCGCEWQESEGHE